MAHRVVEERRELPTYDSGHVMSSEIRDSKAWGRGIGSKWFTSQDKDPIKQRLNLQNEVASGKSVQETKAQP
jgi:hypothetical protein